MSAVRTINGGIYEAHQCNLRSVRYEIALRHAEELDRLRAENAQLRASLDKINDDCLRAEQENERLRQLHAGHCVHMVRLGIPSFGTLDEAIDKMAERAERAEAALTTARRDALEEAAKCCEAHIGDDCGSYDGITIAQATRIADDEARNCAYAIRALAQKEVK